MGTFGPKDTKSKKKLRLSYFISKRISQGKQEGFSSTIHKIAVVTIAIGLGASIISFLIMKGFQEKVAEKIFGFRGHLIITRFTMNNSFEEQPVNYRIDVYENPEEYPYVDHVQEYAHKAGLIKTTDEVVGVLVKGVGMRYGTEVFGQNMVEGEFIHFPDSGYALEVVLSRVIASKINASVGDDIVVHFFQNPPRFRKLKVAGIYETNLSEYFDSRVIIGDLRMIQRLNDWPDSLAGGLEVFVKDPKYIDEAGMAIGEAMDYDLNIQRVSDLYIQVFQWLALLSRQVNILLGIILTVICVNMISIVLILVMERTQMIGILKAVGASDRLIRSVFVYNGLRLVLKGMVFGNLLGIGLCYLQHRFGIVTLNPRDYFMDVVPISWHWEIVGILNIITLLIVTSVLLIPTAVVSRISPIKAIRFD